jgi:hypothetical protein
MMLWNVGIMKYRKAKEMMNKVIFVNHRLLVRICQLAESVLAKCLNRLNVKCNAMQAKHTVSPAGGEGILVFARLAYGDQF